MQNRIERISKACDVDAIVISNGQTPFLDRTFWYMTGQKSGTFESSFAVIKDNKLNVITGILEEVTARNASGNVLVYETGKDRDSLMSELLKGCSKIGLKNDAITYGAAEYIRRMSEGSEFVNVSKNISDVTSVKDAEEIRTIRKACSISSRVANEIPSLVKDGITEIEMAGSIDSLMRKYGGSGNAFDTISAFGEHSAEPHYMPSSHSVSHGDPMLFDFGSKYELYCSDLTRTVFYGKPKKILEDAYRIVVESKTAGMSEIRDGANAKDADLAARKIIDDSEFKERFIHSFGHGIGMDIHQDISLSPRSDDVLREGMIVSAEPGIYLPGIGGIRIEDTLLVTKNGFEKLTDFDQTYTVI